MATLLRTPTELAKALSEGFYCLQGTIVVYEDKETEELVFMVSGSPPTESVSLKERLFSDFEQYLTWKLGK